jgi:hypothetical protein
MLVVNSGGIRCEVSRTVVGEITGVWISLFGLSECLEEVGYDGRSRGVCLVCVCDVIDSSVTVLELPITDVRR